MVLVSHKSLRWDLKNHTYPCTIPPVNPKCSEKDSCKRKARSERGLAHIKRELHGPGAALKENRPSGPGGLLTARVPRTKRAGLG